MSTYAESIAGLQVDAVTGGYACGKSTVLNYLKSKGYPVIDADKVGHEFLESPNPVYQRILSRFGDDLVDSPGGPIIRARLRQRAFATPELKKELEDMMLPAIAQRLEEYICTLSQHGHRRIFVEVPMLFESRLHRRYSRIVCVSATPEIQLRNAMARNQLSEEEARRRIEMQWPLKYKEHLSDYTIDNSGSLEETYAKVDAFLKESEQDAQIALSSEARNDDYRRTIARLSRLCTAHVLQKMGDLCGVAHKDGCAEVILKVSVKSPDSHGQPQLSEQQLKLNVNVCLGSVPPAKSLPDHRLGNPPGCPPKPTPPPCRTSGSTVSGAQALLLGVLYILLLLGIYWAVNLPEHLLDTSPCRKASVNTTLLKPISA